MLVISALYLNLLILSIPAQLSDSTATADSLLRNSADTCFNLGKSFYKSNKFDSSTYYYKTAMEKYYRLNQRNLYISCMQRIGNNARLEGRYEEAFNLLNESMEYAVREFSKESEEFANTLVYLGLVYEESGDFYKGLECYESAAKIQEKVLGYDHIEASKIYNNIGNIYIQLTDYYLALEYHKKSLQIKLKELGETHYLTATSYNNIGLSYELLNLYDEAIFNLKKSLKIKMELLGQKHFVVANTFSNLGMLYMKKHEIDSAMECYINAHKIRCEIFGEGHKINAITLTNLGLLYGSKGDFSKALEMQFASLEIAKKHVPFSRFDMADIYKRIADIYFAKSEYDSCLINAQLSLSSVYIGFDDKNIYENPLVPVSLMSPKMKEPINKKIISKYSLLSSLVVKAEALFYSWINVN